MTVTVLIPQHDDTARGLARLVSLGRPHVVPHFHDPHGSVFVKNHGDWIDDLRLTGYQLDLESILHFEVQ